jgi:OmpA-OmpF porin, OOP family
MIRIGILLILLTPVLSNAQVQLGTKSKKAIELYTEADNFRVRGQYNQAAVLLNQAIDKDKNFVEAHYRLGLVYFTIKNYTKAIQSFENAIAVTTDVRKHKIIWFDLGEAYMLTGQYQKAITTFSDFIKAEMQNKQKLDRANLFLNNAKFALQNQIENAHYQQRALSDTVNCFAMQYFPVLTADQEEIIFTRRLGNGADDDEDLVTTHKDPTGRWFSPQPLSPLINTKFNEGTCTISADGRKLIFTSCTGRKSFGSCDLFESTKVGDMWSEPVNLGANVNSSDWESQPSLSADGRVLYFVSDRRGGFGRRDIWFSKLNDNGIWEKAQNLGAPINTQWDEISPFIHVNNKVLYFSSSGLTGFGGYDIFYAERTPEGWDSPVNMGSPINNHGDQFSLFITADGEKGYYSHEDILPEGGARSKIFEIKIPDNQKIKYKSNYVKGIVTDSKTTKKLKAKIELVDINKNEVVSIVQSDSVSGKYLMVLTEGSEYALYVNKRGYMFKSLNFNYSENADLEPLNINIALDPVVKGSISVLQNIFFDVDKYELKEKSLTELEKIVRFLQENPQVTIEISGHTDNTGNFSYNQQLSEKRAKAVYEYVKQKGINPKRLASKGYGPSNPVSSNETEAGRQLNRRIEFKVQ